MPVFSSMTVRRSRTGNGSRDIKVKSCILKNDISRNLLNLSIYARKILSIRCLQNNEKQSTMRTMIVIDSNETMHLRGNEIHEDR